MIASSQPGARVTMKRVYMRRPTKEVLRAVNTPVMTTVCTERSEIILTRIQDGSKSYYNNEVDIGRSKMVKRDSRLRVEI